MVPPVITVSGRLDREPGQLLTFGGWCEEVAREVGQVGVREAMPSASNERRHRRRRVTTLRSVPTRAALRDFYAYLFAELPALIDRWREQPNR
jgi:hypothetical protein